MLNHIASDAGASETSWALYSARHAVDQALLALEDAGAALLPLAEQSQWHARGVMALNELIHELRARTASEVGELSSRRWEIDALAAS